MWYDAGRPFLPPGVPTMRLVCWACLLSAVCTARAADFPEPSKLPASTELPDPLVSFKGKKITTKDEWFKERRPELKKLFEHYMYGRLPEERKVAGKVIHEDAKAFGGKATLREIAVYMKKEWPPIHVLLVVPNERKGPLPAFV